MKFLIEFYTSNKNGCAFKSAAIIKTKNMLRLSAIAFSFLLFYSCKEGKKIKKDYMSGAGIVECIGYVPGAQLSSGKQSVLDFRIKVWYQDSFAIEEVIYFKSRYFNDSPVYELRIVKHYRFNDLRNEKIYLYHTFSDTSVCFKQYSFSDTIQVESGWGFNFKKEIEYSVPPIPAGDTIIDDVPHKEVRYIYEGKPQNKYVRGFFRCDKSQGPFNFDPELSNQFGCPLTTTIYMDSTFSEIYSVSKVSFITDTLTPEENKVFDAWVKYAKENLVNK